MDTDKILKGGIEMKKINIDLFILQIVAAILTIFIHAPFPGVFGEIVESIARISNPLFFIISGYFCCDKVSYKRILHTITICILIHCVYAGWGLFDMFAFEIGPWLVWIGNRMSLRNIITSQMIGIWGGDWWLISLIMCECCYALIVKANVNEKVLYFFPLVLLAKIYIGEFCKDIPIHWHRNFWMFAFPCYILGVLLYKNRERIVPSINYGCLMLIVGIGFICSIFESLLINPKCDFYVGTSISVIGLFLLGFKRDKYMLLDESLTKVYAVLYYFHLLVINIINKFGENINSWIKPIIVVFLTINIWILYTVAKNIQKRLRQSIAAKNYHDNKLRG